MGYRITSAGLTFPSTRSKRTKTEGILIHHPDADWTVKQVHDYHIKKGWNGIGYNLYIDTDGTIYEGRGLDYVGAHCTDYNSKTIGICCRGRFNSTDRSMPDAQFNALIGAIGLCKQKYGNGLYIKGHKEVASTACPGQYFPLTEVKTLKYRSNTTNPTPSASESASILEDNEMSKEDFLKLLNEVDPMYYDLVDVPKYHQDYVAELILSGAISGNGTYPIAKRQSQIESMIAIIKYYRQLDPTYLEVSDCPTWMQPVVQELIDSDTIAGDGKHGLNKTYSQLISAIISMRYTMSREGYYVAVK